MKLRTFLLLLVTLIACGEIEGQVSTDQGNTTSGWIDNSDKKLLIGGYGEVHYNQPVNSVGQNGKLDVHRLVLLFGYNFNKKLSFMSEVEFEHVKELYVEQAFINYKFKDYFQMKGGLLLMPMGIVNEYHEPTTFNGVERPFIDNVMVPTTWREIGLGISGNVKEASLRYQLYLVNGFLGYDGSAKLKGSNGFRSGRQKGAESIMTTPNVIGKVSYYGLKGLNLGFSVYAGQTESTMFSGIDRSNELAMQTADSSRVNLTMVGLDARYDYKALHLRGQLNFNSVGNTDAYNGFTGSDLGSQMLGYYVEAGYNVFKHTKYKTKLIPFVRLEKYNTHFDTEENTPKNEAYDRTAITTGLTWKLSDGVSVKTDYQFLKNKPSDWNGQFNLGFGVWFR